MSLAAESRGHLLWLRRSESPDSQVFQTRVLGVEGETLLLSQPYRDGRLVVFPKSVALTLNVTDPASGASRDYAAEVLEQRLRPVPSLLVTLPPGLMAALEGSEGRRARVLAVASGKGGVGKSTVTANLAVALAEQGQRVTVLDADLGMANVDVLFGLNPEGTLTHLLKGEKSLDEITMTGPAGVQLIPGGSGLAELANLNEWQFGRLLDSLMPVEQQADLLLIDTGAGLSRNVTNFFLAADEVLLVTTPEPPAILDAYGILKTLAERRERLPVNIVVNRAGSAREAEGVAKRLADTAERYLGFRPHYVGAVAEDPHAVEAVKRQTLLISHNAVSPAARNLRDIARQLLALHEPLVAEQEAAAPQLGFFQRLRQLFSHA